MNQKDWVEYFEAVNGRKPSMQEFQEARENGEFVVNKPDTPASSPVAPQPQVQPTGPAGYSQPLASPKKPRFHKKTVIGLSIAGLVAVIGLVCFFFFSSGPDLDGIWLTDTASRPLVYELNRKEKKLNGDYPIRKVIKGNEAKKEFNDKLSSLDSSAIQTLADVDNQYQLKTKEVVIIKTDSETFYNLLQENGTNVMLSDNFKDLIYYRNAVPEFKKMTVFKKLAFPKFLVGKWEVVEGENEEEEEDILQLSDHGISKRSSNSYCSAVYSLVDSARINSSDGDSHSLDDKVNTEFEHVQKAVAEQGYKINSAKDVYKESYSNSYIIPVEGGKKFIALDKNYHFSIKAEKVN